MAILKKCNECERLGGYAESVDDDVCLRCKRKANSSGDSKRKNKSKDEDEE